MTISSTVLQDIYDGDGATIDWAITFPVTGLTDDDIELYISEGGVSTLVTTGFEIDLTAPEATYPTVASGLDPLTTDQKIVVRRTLDLKQEQIDVDNQGAIPLTSIETGFDRITMMCQQIQEEVDRSVKVDFGQTTTDELIEAIEVSVAAAASSASAASASETAAGLSETAASGYADDASGYADEAAASAASITFRTHEQTFDADDLSSGVLTLTTPTGYTKIVTYSIWDELEEQIFCGDTFNNSTLALDLSSFEDSGDLTGATTWTIRSTWGATA